MVARYGQAIGIEFIAKALSREPGSRSEVLWYDADDSIWHETLKNSDGLKAPPRRPIDVNQLASGLQDLYQEFLPHYQHLYEYRLRPNQ